MINSIHLSPPTNHLSSMTVFRSHDSWNRSFNFQKQMALSFPFSFFFWSSPSFPFAFLSFIMMASFYLEIFFINLATGQLHFQWLKPSKRLPASPFICLVGQERSILFLMWILSRGSRWTPASWCRLVVLAEPVCMCQKVTNKWIGLFKFLLD